MEMLIDRDLAGAKWARVAGLGDGRRDQAQAALFRLEFRLEGPVQRAELRVSAADRYRLYVNGESLVSGPRKGDQWNRYYETVDLAPHLRPGDNSLTARVVSYAFESAQTAQNAPLSVYVAPVGPLFLAKGDVQTADGATLSLSTGEAAWTACAGGGAPRPARGRNGLCHGDQPLWRVFAPVAEEAHDPQPARDARRVCAPAPEPRRGGRVRL